MRRSRAATLDITVTDQFCGAGGSSLGAVAAGADVRLAMNHWSVAIETHNSNFPDTDHVCADIQTTDPRRYASTDILITSPECTNHSNAKRRSKGRPEAPTLFDGKEEEERSRATMWDVPRFAEYHDYQLIIVENVVEAAKWDLFPAWCHAMELLGYEGKPVFMNSMTAHPVPQSRDRMYYVWWKSGNRAPDLEFPIDAWCPACEKRVEGAQTWNEPTKAWPILPHWGKFRSQYHYTCPECSERVAPIVYPALSAIDWTIEGTRIGDRDTPLTEATMGRIQRGLEKYADLPPMLIPVSYGARPASKQARSVGEPSPTLTARLEHGIMVPVGGNTSERPGQVRATDLRAPTVAMHTTAAFAVCYPQPFIAELKGGGSNARPVQEPLATIHAGGNHHMLVAPSAFYVKQYGKGDDPSMAHELADPLGAVTAQDHHALVEVPPTFVVKNYGNVDEAKYRSKPIDEPLGAVTTSDHHSLVQMPLTVAYYGTGQAHPVIEPIGTMTTKDRYAVVEPKGEPTHPPAVEDCTFRMLEPHEVGRAMTFPDEYRVVGNKRQRVRQYGNAVTPPVMAKLIERGVESLA